MPPFQQALLIFIVAVSIVLMLIRPKNLPEVAWVSSGALLLIVLRLIPLKLAGKAIAEGLDVYLFLIGMMLLSELAREHAVFDWLSSAAVHHAGGSSSRLFLLVYLSGVLVTTCMSNDATAVVLTPAVLAVVRKSKAKPIPFLFACAMVANAASFVLPISNPANLVVFHAGMPPLGRWLLFFGVPSIFSIVATFLVLRWYFREQLQCSINGAGEQTRLNGNGKLVLAGLTLVVGVLLTVSALHKDLGMPTCLAAIAIVVAVSLKAKSNPLVPVRGISWSTIALVAALFILVNAVEAIGALQYVSEALHWAGGLPRALGVLTTGFVVGIANNLINNLPLGLLAGAVLQHAHVPDVLANAVLVGVDLGPNLSVTGSLATILWLLALRREELDISFADFIKVGVVAMPTALLASMLGLLLMQKLW